MIACRRLAPLALLVALILRAVPAQDPHTGRAPAPTAPPRGDSTLIVGAKVLAEDGRSFREGVAVLLDPSGTIEAIDTREALTIAMLDERRSYGTFDFEGRWLIPGLIDLHSHLLLHPYDEASWNDQVLTESLELRTIRATVAARATLEAGFTALRELGTEGAAFADVALRDAIDQGIIPGPRLFCATRALVATGCYGPSGFDPRWELPVGAQVADGPVGVRVAVRQQVAAGADWIKVYADYRRKPGDPSTPTFSPEELHAIVAEATSAGVPVAAHAVTDEAIRRAVQAGVRTIEHGYQAGPETLALMREKGVVLCPTLAANEAIVRYRGIEGPAAERLNIARITFQRALAAGVTIACGSDVGVFAHGANARELELMVDYGMTPTAAVAAATSVAADVLGRPDLGRIAVGAAGDLVALDANPLEDIAALRQVRAVLVRGALLHSR